MIIPLGIAAFVVFYLVFRFAITKFNLMTPGREDVDEVDVSDEKPAIAEADGKYAKVASDVLVAVGGKENVKNVDFCATRLRFEVNDGSKIDEDGCKQAGALGVVKPSDNSVQVVIGVQVQAVFDELEKLL